ncbi:MAG: phosphoserine transaminase [Halanaerobiaceae bacterium]
MKPEEKPRNPCFSSGPCAKYPAFDVEKLKNTPFGRSHRSNIGKSRLKEAIDRSKEILGIPEDYRVGIVPASDTGAVEMALWNFLGPRPVDVICFESFGRTWAGDILDELKLDDVKLLSADYGELPELSCVNFEHDVVFTWNGTTSGVRVPDGDWIADDREGLTICDATSAVFAMDIPWEKLDVVTYSWQKVMGGEAAHGMLILSPAAVERAKNYDPPRPLPKIFRLFKGEEFNEGLFKGSTINTPSMICTQDYLEALDWAESVGGLEGLIERSQNNLAVIEDFVAERDWIDFLAESKEIRSNTSVTLKLDLSEEKIDRMVELLAEEGAGYDISSYRKAPPGLRIWCGATVESDDVALLMEWIDWAYNKVN